MEFIDIPTLDPMAAASSREPWLLQLIREDIHCVRLRDPAARSEMETLLTYPGVHALIWHRIAHRLWGAGWKFPARLLSWLGRFLSNVDIHPAATIGHRFFIDHGAGVVIGETAEIGDDVTIRQGVTLGIKSAAAPRDAPVIGNRVDIGAGAKLSGKIRIGDDVVIGANAVVLTDVPARSIAVGVPATIRPRRDKER